MILIGILPEEEYDLTGVCGDGRRFRISKKLSDDALLLILGPHFCGMWYDIQWLVTIAKAPNCNFGPCRLDHGGVSSHEGEMKSLLKENYRFQALYDGVRLGLMKEKMEVMYRVSSSRMGSVWGTELLGKKATGNQVRVSGMVKCLLLRPY